MALVALDEMEKNNNPLYRFGSGPGAGRRGTIKGVSAVAVFLPAQLSGGGPGQPEGFQDEYMHPSPQRSFHVGARGLVP